MHSQIPKSLFAFILLIHVSNAVLMNQTIDDSLGDSLTGLKVQYLPSDSSPVWRSQDTCNNCAITPDRTRTYDNTWSSNTCLGSENVTIMFPFRGTAIYVYSIIPNVPAVDQIVSTVDCNFLVDGRLAGSYTHVSDESFELQYNTLIYANTSLSDAAHTLLIQMKSNSFMIFDYAQYTIDAQVPVSPATTPIQPGTNSTSRTNTLTAPTPIGVIAGAVVSGVAGIALIALVVILCYRRAHRHIKHDNTPMINPFVSGGLPATNSVPRLETKHRHTDSLVPQGQAEIEYWTSGPYRAEAAVHSPGDRPGPVNGPVKAETSVESRGWNFGR